MVSLSNHQLSALESWFDFAHHVHIDWLPSLLVSLLFVGSLIVKRFLFAFLKKKSIKRPSSTLFLLALERPATLLLLGAFLSSLTVLFPTRWTETAQLVSKFIAILAVAIFCQKLLLVSYGRYIIRHESLRTYAGLTRVFISIGVYILFILIFLDTVGIAITPLIASLGVGSIAVALALQDTLSNLFAGFYMAIDKPVRVGDFIKLESGDEGYVETIGWRSVRIRLLSNNTVVIPNVKLSGSLVTNYYLPQPELAVTVSVVVSYLSDLGQIEKITVEVARETLKDVVGAIPDFEPFIRYHTFGDLGVQFTVILRAKEFVDQYLIKHEFVKRLHHRYAKEGIVIPVRVCHDPGSVPRIGPAIHSRT